MTEPSCGALWDQVQSLPDLLTNETWPMEARLRLALSTPEIYRLRRIVLVGSGDSHAAALACAHAMAQLTGLPVQALTAMEGARYLPTALGPRLDDVLVVAISNSGEAARVVEAAEQLAARGVLVVALTAAPQSSLAKAVGRVLDVTIAASRPAPGVRSYVAALVGLSLLAIRMAEVRMRITMDAAQARRKAIVDLAAPVAAAVQASRAFLPALARAWSSYTTADVIGSGPELGTAAYAAAKLIEAVGIHAAVQEGEEFHHLNYYVARRATTPALLFWPHGSAAESRLSELWGYLAKLERPRLLVAIGLERSDDPHVLSLPPAPLELAPILHAVPAAALAAEWGSAIDSAPFRAFAPPWDDGRGSGIVRNSQRIKG
jgi:glucosamine--fructose-6-phosphate aminotransferase (isomerizing)